MIIDMTDKKKEYIKNVDSYENRIFRTENILVPLLVIAPLLVGFFLIHDWYLRDFLWNEFDLVGELMIGIIIIIGNIMFDIPLIRSLKRNKKRKK